MSIHEGAAIFVEYRNQEFWNEAIFRDGLKGVVKMTVGQKEQHQHRLEWNLKHCSFASDDNAEVFPLLSLSSNNKHCIVWQNTMNPKIGKGSKKITFDTE